MTERATSTATAYQGQPRTTRAAQTAVMTVMTAGNCSCQQRDPTSSDQSKATLLAEAMQEGSSYEDCNDSNANSQSDSEHSGEPERIDSYKADSSRQAKRLRERRRQKKRVARLRAQAEAKAARDKLDDCVDRETPLNEQATHPPGRCSSGQSSFTSTSN